MTYPETPGFQAHSDTSRAAAERLQSAESMERDIFDVLDAYDSGWTGDELAEYLETRGHAGVQTGTVAARLRGLELKGLAVKTKETRLTRSNRKAHVWLSKRLATRNGSELAPTANGPTVQELTRRTTDMSLLIYRLCRQLPADNKARLQAMDYLKRHDLGGSPLREEGQNGCD